MDSIRIRSDPELLDWFDPGLNRIIFPDTDATPDVDLSPDADAGATPDADLTPDEETAQMLMRFRLRIQPPDITFVKCN